MWLQHYSVVILCHKEPAKCVFVFVKLKSVVTDSEVLTKSNKIKELMEVKIDTIRNQQSEQTLS